MSRPHICSVFVRRFAERLAFLNEGVAHDLGVIADQFDGYMNGYFELEERHAPFVARERERRFVRAYDEWHGLEPRRETSA
jgi:hypothetical protein